MGLNDPLRISSLISALPTDPDAPRTTAEQSLGVWQRAFVEHARQIAAVDFELASGELVWKC